MNSGAARHGGIFREMLERMWHAARYYQGRLRSKVVGRRVVALMVDTKRGPLLVDPEDMGVGRKLAKDGEYGEGEIALLEKLANQHSNVLFVGSHVGALAIPVSEFVHSVTAIEANPHTFKLLSANAAIRRRTNFRAVQVAASDRKAPLQFVLNRTNSGGSKRLPLERLNRYFYDNPSVVEITANRLDDVLADAYDVVVMDLEGSEYYALKGMTRILSTARHLIVEFVPHHLSSVAGVSVSDFVDQIEPFFDRLYIPSRGLIVARHSFTSELEKLYEAGASDDGIIFSKQTAAGSVLP